MKNTLIVLERTHENNSHSMVRDGNESTDKDVPDARRPKDAGFLYIQPEPYFKPCLPHSKRCPNARAGMLCSTRVLFSPRFARGIFREPLPWNILGLEQVGRHRRGGEGFSALEIPHISGFRRLETGTGSKWAPTFDKDRSDCEEKKGRYAVRAARTWRNDVMVPLKGISGTVR